MAAAPYQQQVLEKRMTTPPVTLQPASGNIVANGQGEMLLCAVCCHPVTAKDARTEIHGAHAHTFANPGGHIFRIGCFSSAPGCVAERHETAEFTWFSGYTWAACGCASCRSHLGWQYRSPCHLFFGLILDRLVENKRPTD